MNDTLIIIILVGGLAAYTIQRIDKLQTYLENQFSHPPDDRLEAAASRATESLHKQKDRLLEYKRMLPKIDLWEISINRDWEPNLISGAESLRPLIEKACGENNPDSYYVRCRAEKVPMTYELAHELAQFAHAEIDISVRKLEWLVSKTQASCELKKHNTDFLTLASCEQNVAELAKNIRDMESAIPNLKRQVWSAFTKAEQATQTELGADISRPTP